LHCSNYVGEALGMLLLRRQNGRSIAKTEGERMRVV